MNFLVVILLHTIALSTSQDSIEFRDKVLEVGSSCMQSSGCGICVLLENCNISYIDISIKQPPLCFFHQEKIPVICCPLKNVKNMTSNDKTNLLINSAGNIFLKQTDNIKNTTIPSSSIITKNSTTKSSLESPLNSTRLSILKCREYSQNYTTVKYRKPFIKIGIVGGTLSFPGQYPHMAAIGMNDSDHGLKFFCGGSLISERYILTAAHCLTRATPTIVRLGEHNLLSHLGNDDVEDFGIESLIPHPLYHTTSVYNDIALIKLNKRVKFKKNIRPACLSDEKNENHLGLIAIGWGDTSFSGTPSSILQEVTLEYFSFEECSKDYPPVRRMKKGLQHTQLCAGSRSGEKDTCQGDSGGPLSTFTYSPEVFGNIYTIVGVTSFGKGCGSKIPAIYTRVLSYRDWIESIAWS